MPVCCEGHSALGVCWVFSVCFFVLLFLLKKKKTVFKGFVTLCKSYEVITNARLIVCEEAASLEEVLP